MKTSRRVGGHAQTQATCNPEGGGAMVEEGVPLEIQLLWFCVRMQWCSFIRWCYYIRMCAGCLHTSECILSGCNVKLVAAGSTVAVWG